MSNTNPGVVQDYNAPDIHDEDTASVQDAINKSHERREAAKEANRSKTLKTKRRRWWELMRTMTIYYIGTYFIITHAVEWFLPTWLAVVLGIVMAFDCFFRMKWLIRAYPKK